MLSNRIFRVFISQRHAAPSSSIFCRSSSRLYTNDVSANPTAVAAAPVKSSANPAVISAKFHVAPRIDPNLNSIPETFDIYAAKRIMARFATESCEGGGRSGVSYKPDYVGKMLDWMLDRLPDLWNCNPNDILSIQRSLSKMLNDPHLCRNLGHKHNRLLSFILQNSDRISVHCYEILVNHLNLLCRLHGLKIDADLQQALLVALNAKINSYTASSIESEATSLFYRLFDKSGINLTMNDRSLVSKICRALANDLEYKARSNAQSHFTTTLRRTAILFMQMGPDLANVSEDWWPTWVKYWNGIVAQAPMSAEMRSALVLLFMEMCIEFYQKDTFVAHFDTLLIRLSCALGVLNDTSRKELKESIDRLMDSAPVWVKKYSLPIQTVFLKADTGPKRNIFLQHNSDESRYSETVISNASLFVELLCNGAPLQSHIDFNNMSLMAAVLEMAIDLSSQSLRISFIQKGSNRYINMLTRALENNTDQHDAHQTRHLVRIVDLMHRINRNQFNAWIKAVATIDHLSRVFDLILARLDGIKLHEIEIVVNAICGIMEESRTDFEVNKASQDRLAQMCRQYYQNVPRKVDMWVREPSQTMHNFFLKFRLPKPTKEQDVELVFRTVLLPTQRFNRRDAEFRLIRSAQVMLLFEPQQTPPTEKWLDKWAHDWVARTSMSAGLHLGGYGIRLADLFGKMCFKFDRPDMLESEEQLFKQFMQSCNDQTKTEFVQMAREKVSAASPEKIEFYSRFVKIFEAI